jgi:hypothetical protein
VFRAVGISAGAPVAADAPAANDKDNPAAPNTGNDDTVLRRRLPFEGCFVCDILETSHTFEQMFGQSVVRVTLSYAGTSACDKC